MRKKPKLGRPRLPPGENRGKALNVRFRPEERARLDAAAEAAGERLSDWARRVLLAEADRRA
jgi:uncharacterized protein (DUF1778 family)